MPDEEWHFTIVKWHLISKKCHFSSVKCHSTDEVSIMSESRIDSDIHEVSPYDK